MDGYSYDASFDLLNDGAHGYAYDAEHRIVSVDSGATASYIYNAEGERVHESVGGAVTEFLHGPGALRGAAPFALQAKPARRAAKLPRGRERRSERRPPGKEAERPSGAQRRLGALGPPSRREHKRDAPPSAGLGPAPTLGLITVDGSQNTVSTEYGLAGRSLATATASGVFYTDADTLGTVRARANSSNAIVETDTSWPFGELRVNANGISKIHFTRKLDDTESGLDYFGARYYNSSLSRFMTPDWSEAPEAIPYSNTSDPQSLNLYSYVLNNPVAATDPDGHWCVFGHGNSCTKKAPLKGGGTAAAVGGAYGPTSSWVSRHRLANAQNKAMIDPNLQPGAHGAASHCSEATCQIGRAVGANTSPLGPAGGGYYDANTQVKNLADAAAIPGSGWRKTDLGSAQNLADQGKFVVIGWENPNGGSGHTVTVMADPNNERGATNPTVAQVGGSTGNGAMPFRNAFGADKRGAVQVYVYVGH